MELYSADGEYLCTAEGVRIDGEIASDDQDDHGKLYCLQHSFTAPVTSFMLKVMCTCTSSCCENTLSQIFPNFVTCIHVHTNRGCQ